MVDLTQNYFELFQLPVSCEVDLEMLAGRYRQLQKTVHPDRFVRASKREQMLSIQYAAHVNEGYNTLKEPLLRAGYLLKLSGRDMDMEKNTLMDSEFLFEQMELRDEVSQLKTATASETDFNELKSRIDKGVNDLLCKFESYWKSGTIEGLDQAEQVVRKLQFMVKLATELGQLESRWMDN